MELNIALNTIVYLMIFLFPGILFRKFYFRGEFTKQFQQGNLMERFVWNILFSIVCLVLCASIFYTLRHHCNIKIFDSISYNTLENVFKPLSNNELPEEVDVKTIYLDFSTLILAVYIISMTLGYVSYGIVISLGIDRISPIFRFKNYWHYLIKAKALDGTYNKNKKHLFTVVDVLVDNNVDNVLYTGYLQDYFIDSQSNKLESLILKNSYRYKKIKTDSETKVEKKIIPGDILCIQSDRIINLNLTFFQRDKTYELFKKIILQFINLSYYLSIIFFSIMPWIYFEFSPLNSTTRKIAFIVNTFFIVTCIRGILAKPFSNFKTLKFVDTFYIMLLFIIPFLWIFNVFNFYITLLTEIVYFIILIISRNPSSKK